MKKKTTQPNVQRKPQPRMDWQVEEYDRFPEVRLILPYQFLLHGYGQHRYMKKELRKLFSEMNAVGLLFPKQAPDKLSDLYCQWREAHLTHWFDKWISKNNRNLTPGTGNEK